MSQLTAYLGGRRAGTFISGGRGEAMFHYDPSWVGGSGRQQLSLSLPKTAPEHRGPPVTNFLWGLLPDNERTLLGWSRRFGVSHHNAFSLLAHVGLDVAGGIQLSTDSTMTLERPGGFDAVSDSGIAAHLRALHADPSAWLLDSPHEGRFSLAGAQAKFALAKTDDGWGIPWGSAASTHIFKPGIDGLDHHDLNEHLCMVAARNLGLNVAESAAVDFEGQTAIVLTRYDRADGARIHQEDLCQALGLHPAVKYESDGGPTLARIIALFRDAMRPRQANTAIDSLCDAVAYNWLIAGTDAHAKNYSILHGVGGPTLAPLYDIASVLPYPHLRPQNAKLAMSVGGTTRVSEIDSRAWAREAAAIGVDEARILGRIRDLADRVLDAFIDANRATGVGDSAWRGNFVDKVAERVEAAKKTLDRPIKPATARREQPRAPRGRFAARTEK